MTTPQDLKEKLWKAVDSDRTVMLGLADGQDLPRPMTAQLDGKPEGYAGDLWFFTSSDTSLYQELQPGKRALINFASKGHDLFACIDGTLAENTDRAVIDRLWNPFVAAWYEGGKDDPKLRLLKFSPADAQIWENASSLIAGIKILFGADPKEEYKDKVAKVALS